MLKNYSKVEIDKDRAEYYYSDEGKFHRLDGPAIERPDGSKFWCINGNYHRNIDPSDEWSIEEKCWFFNNKAHRIGGSHGSEEEIWHIHGKSCTKQEYFNKVWNI